MVKGIYHEKEKCIFEGIISLIKKGNNPYSIKVSDIAKEADVGKGTIYDYFKSKEEAISKAILYNISLLLNETFMKIDRENTFKGKFYGLLYVLWEETEKDGIMCKLLPGSQGFQDFYEYLSEYKDYVKDNWAQIMRINDTILKAGKDEGLIELMGEENRFYREMVMSGALGAFMQYLHTPPKGISLEEAMDASFKLLVKALN